MAGGVCSEASGSPPQLRLRIYSVPGQLPVFPARSPPWMNIWSVHQNGRGGGGTPSPRSQRTFLQVCGRDPARLFGPKVRWGQRGQPQVIRIQGWRRGQVQGWRQLGGWEGEGKACRCAPGYPSSAPPPRKQSCSKSGFGHLPMWCNLFLQPVLLARHSLRKASRTQEVLGKHMLSSVG